MVNDLKQSEGLVKHDLIAAIAGDTSARLSMGAQQREVDPRGLDRVAPEAEFSVVEADSSQQCAIDGIALGQCAVVHGPPGTGKSQTITNLIATLAARGKTVLFVAEKRAALEVVQQRLAKSGLDHLAIDLHGADTSPKKVMDRIAKTLQTVRNAPLPNVAELHQQFVDRRSRLNMHDQTMHKVSTRSGKSLYEMQGFLLRLPKEASTSLRWRGPELAAITTQKAGEGRDLLREAGPFASLMMRTDASPWLHVKFRSGNEAQHAIDVVQQLFGVRATPSDGAVGSAYATNWF